MGCCDIKFPWKRLFISLIIAVLFTLILFWWLDWIFILPWWCWVLIGIFVFYLVLWFGIKISENRRVKEEKKKAKKANCQPQYVC